ncbi:insecticidal toxin protein [Paenibacillus sp. H1-7]|uniref:Tc toxin subunit A-related protein n=1 Tax=Paenibacillus sp. H1-7 TaxID=2282849 RepID=UPI001EF87C21|nr:hypothetical protein [Paenibacillus sp. H1-7]ULL16716.1 insecticidal toxin protein [Paenibacillus sp. H1-7]
MKYGNWALSTFHGSVQYLDFVRLDAQRNGAEETGERHIVTRTRSLRYRFYPHFHSYIEELKTRLIEKSVHGLQAADTDYKLSANNDGTYETLPNSFQAMLPAGLVLQLPLPGQDDEEITLPFNITVALPDGVKIDLDGGQAAILPGSVIARDDHRGTRVRVEGGTLFRDLDNGTETTLASAAIVTLPAAAIILGEDGIVRKLAAPQAVTVPIGTSVKPLGGKPKPTLFRELFTAAQYSPANLVEQPYPVRDLDFSSSGAYSVYNWELFYHIPLAIAIHLSKNQRFEEAQRWFHYIFDPTDDSDGTTPERFWKVKPFQSTEVKQIEDILVNLSSGADYTLQQDTINNINAWKDAPFRPHLVARYRHTAYMYKAVMAYLDNLIDWGDYLFGGADSAEAVTEALQPYVLASLILGVRPQAVPRKGSLKPLTYADRRGKWDEFDNTLVQMESELPFDLAPFPMTGGAGDSYASLQSIGTSLYFCVPRNDKLMGYWDTVADRLFKIRNSLNLQGVFCQLPLFDPPIDPALLARAAASGLDVGSVIAGINQPLPLVCFRINYQMALDICQIVISLGNNLLAAIEKEDNEKLALLRAQHESGILGLAEKVKFNQWREAAKNRESLEVSLKNVKERYIYLELLLGNKREDIEKKLPQLVPIEATQEGYIRNEQDPEYGRRDVRIDNAEDLSESGGTIVSRREMEELEKLSTARMLYEFSKLALTAAPAASNIPDFNFDFHFWGIGGHATIGGTALARNLQFAAELAQSMSDRLNYEAGMAAKIAVYDRRQQEWENQSNIAVGEMNQIVSQIRAAEIREYIAKQEYNHHMEQMNNTAAIENFLKNEKNEEELKKTTVSFYTWMKREIRGLYSQAYKFAYAAAKKAERALQHELGKPELTFLQYGYMSGKEGLLAGEKLQLDLKRMEAAYHEMNQREYELTKHVSLLMVKPMALVQLRTTGQCTVKLPESLFDMDGPGHYFRRIKSVALSIPCVTGPYSSVNCTLTLQKSTIRKSSSLRDNQYVRDQAADDDRFSDYFGSTQSIVTSSAQNDSGMFEVNLRDDRYLPFEKAGVISEWQLQLPADPSKDELCQFDYSTISDVIMHIRYTAREGGEPLRVAAKEAINEEIKTNAAAGCVRLFSIRHEFPTEWAKFQNQKPVENKRYELAIPFRKEHYPYWCQNRLDKVAKVELLAGGAADAFNIFRSADKTVDDQLGKLEMPQGKLLKGALLEEALPQSPVDALKLYLDSTEITDLLIAVTWHSHE